MLLDDMVIMCFKISKVKMAVQVKDYKMKKKVVIIYIKNRIICIDALPLEMVYKVSCLTQSG